jgi:hypothetical protein
MDIALILSKKYVGSEWSLDGNKYSNLEWRSKSSKPTEAELESLWADVQYEVGVEAVKQARHSAYTAAGGSDAIYLKYQRGEATEQEWLDAVQAINDANPYPVKEGK